MTATSERIVKLTEAQERFDTFYFRNGPCCAGCDWWRAINSKVGDCTRSRPVNGKARWAMLGIDKISLGQLPAGHIATMFDHKCGEFKDDFDWTTLPLAYRKRIGAPLTDAGRSALSNSTKGETK